MNISRKTMITVIIFIVIFIIIFSVTFNIYGQKTYKDSIKNIYLGEVGVDYNYTKITFPHSINSGSDFNVTIFFNSNISIKYIYTQTSGFCVAGWSFCYNTYVEHGSKQGDFTGTFARNIGILNITINSPKKYYNGIIALHLVGNVPVTVIY